MTVPRSAKGVGSCKRDAQLRYDAACGLDTIGVGKKLPKKMLEDAALEGADLGAAPVRVVLFATERWKPKINSAMLLLRKWSESATATAGPG